MNDVQLPIEYQYRRPDGTVLIRWIEGPYDSFMHLSPDHDQWLTSEPRIIIERRLAHQEDWVVFGEIRNGPDGTEWLRLPT